MNDRVGRITQLTGQRDLELHISDLQLALADERCVREVAEAQVERLRAAVLRASVLFRSLGAPHLAEEMDRALDGRGGEE